MFTSATSDSMVDKSPKTADKEAADLERAEVSTDAGSSSMCSTTTRSSRNIPCKDEIQFSELAFGQHIEPMSRYANTANDIYLLNAFLELSEVQDIDGSSIKLVLLALKFLRNCQYSAVDICSICAHASAYFVDVHSLCGNLMAPEEVGNVLVTAMFLAHSYIQDETCPLYVWHRYLFKGYCCVRELSEAVMRVMTIRRYVLRLADEDLRVRNEKLCTASHTLNMEQVY
jgi:hypothetical protein